MTSAADAIFQLAGLQPSLFAANSRYQGIQTAQYTTPDGRTVSYVLRRFVPRPDRLAQVQQYTLAQGDRLDIVAARFFSDAQLFWRICDANPSLRPESLATPVGTVLRICLPASQAAQNAP